MNKNQKSYYAIIPADIRYNQNICANAKLLYGEITALCNEKGFCWASNQYFADLYQVNKKSISRWIKQLEETGKIYIDTVYNPKNKKIEARHIKIYTPMDKNVPTPMDKNVPTPMDKNVPTPMDKNVQENNTLINNTLINKKSAHTFKFSSDEFKLIKIWNNSEHLRTHSIDTISLYFKKKHRDIINANIIEHIEQAIGNYNQFCAEPDLYYWSTNWTFWEFIVRGLHKFTNDAKPLLVFRKNQKEKQETAEERIDRIMKGDIKYG